MALGNMICHKWMIETDNTRKERSLEWRLWELKSLENTFEFSVADYYSAPGMGGRGTRPKFG